MTFVAAASGPATTIRPALLPAAKTAPKAVAAPVRTVTKVVPVGAVQSGIASWYGPGFAGRRSSDGGTFNPAALTAAHRWLPFGTRARVCTTWGSCVVVTITDRGPYVGGRIIDLSRAAKQALGMGGLAHVTVTPITTKTVTETLAPQRASRSAARTSLTGTARTKSAPVSHNVPVSTGYVAARPATKDALIGFAPLVLLGALGGARVRSRLDLELAELPGIAD